jgi:hypothetical protein
VCKCLSLSLDDDENAAHTNKGEEEIKVAAVM